MPKINFNVEKNIINSYINERLTLKETAEKYNVALNTVWNILKRNNISRRTMSEHYLPNLKHDFFNIIDNEYKAYFLGFLITDGNIGKIDIKNNQPTKRMKLVLNKKDEYILHEFTKVLGVPEKKIHINTRDNAVGLTINSNQICKDLEKYGVIENKTWKTFLPILEDKYMPHLIRGLIDGDGCITSFISSKNKKCQAISLCGTKDLITSIRNYLCNKLDVYYIKENERNNFYSVKWASKKDVIKIGDYIYNNSNIYLTRKYDIMQQIKNL